MLRALYLSLLGLLFRLEFSSQPQIPGVPETTFPCPSLPQAGSWFRAEAAAGLGK